MYKTRLQLLRVIFSFTIFCIKNPLYAQGINFSSADLAQMSPQITLSARKPAATELFNTLGLKANIGANSRISTTLNNDQIAIGFEPPMRIEIPSTIPFAPPTIVTLPFVRYTFNDAKFKVSADVDIDVLGIRSTLFESTLETILNHTVKDKMPASMQRAGYNPWRDRDLQGTLGQLKNIIGGASGASATGPSGLVDARAYITFRNNRDLTLPLSGSSNNMELRVRRNANLAVSLESNGPIEGPRWDSLEVSTTSARGILISPRGTNGEMAMNELNIRRARLTPNSSHFEYGIGVEDFFNGLMALGRTGIALATGTNCHCDNPNGDIRLSDRRAEINRQLEAGAREGLLDFTRNHDNIIPQFSLQSFFGSN